jgi:hypothetical protein
MSLFLWYHIDHTTAANIELQNCIFFISNLMQICQKSWKELRDNKEPDGCKWKIKDQIPELMGHVKNRWSTNSIPGQKGQWAGPVQPLLSKLSWVRIMLWRASYKNSFILSDIFNAHTVLFKVIWTPPKLRNL